MGTNTMYTMYTWNEEPLCWNWAPEPNYTTLMYACEVLKHCSNVKSNVVVFKITSQTEKVMPTNKTNNFFANKSKYNINDNWWDFPISNGTINNSDWFPPKLRVNWGNWSACVSGANDVALLLGIIYLSFFLSLPAFMRCYATCSPTEETLSCSVLTTKFNVKKKMHCVAQIR